MLKIHFTPGTRAGRVVWLLEELGLDYDVNIMPFTKKVLSHRNIGRAMLSEGFQFLKMVIFLYLNLEPSFNIFLNDIKTEV